MFDNLFKNLRPAGLSPRIIHNPEHDTSIAAAVKVSERKPSIRKIVEDFALTRPEGFIDEELQALDPNAPESSFRKRRTELADVNTIVPTGLTRKNSKGQDCIVWTHRDHLANAPEPKKRTKKPPLFESLQNENALLRAALETAVSVAAEARREWDAAPSGMKAGKLLIALSGELKGYRADIDAIHAARGK